VNAFGTAKLSKPWYDIMSIAKDVSKTINIEELMKNGMDPNSSSMQDMVSNVSKDIQSRIDSGEVNQEQLMKEATDLPVSEVEVVS
jgi:S-adenosylmethionine synthetase